MFHAKWWNRLGIKDLELALEKDPKFYLAYFVNGSVFMNIENENDNAIKNFKTFIQNTSPDTNDYVHALYALSVLVKPKNKKNDGRDYYYKAKAAEAKFKALYGVHTGLSDIKREAIQLHESSDEANKLIKEYTPPKAMDQKMQQLIQSGILNASFPPSPTKCSSCGADHLKDKPESPLLACGACRSIWYCSRECQVQDYRANHKAQCKSMQK